MPGGPERLAVMLQLALVLVVVLVLVLLSLSASVSIAVAVAVGPSFVCMPQNQRNRTNFFGVFNGPIVRPPILSQLFHRVPAHTVADRICAIFSR